MPAWLFLLCVAVVLVAVYLFVSPNAGAANKTPTSPAPVTGTAHNLPFSAQVGR